VDQVRRGMIADGLLRRESNRDSAGKDQVQQE
jgi:hypothetical protein